MDSSHMPHVILQNVPDADYRSPAKRNEVPRIKFSPLRPLRVLAGTILYGLSLIMIFFTKGDAIDRFVLPFFIGVVTVPAAGLFGAGFESVFGMEIADWLVPAGLLCPWLLMISSIFFGKMLHMDDDKQVEAIGNWLRELRR